MYPPRTQNFWDGSEKWATVGSKRSVKILNRVMSHSRSIWAWFCWKRWKNLQNDQNCLFWAQSKPLWWQNWPLWVILSRFGVKWFAKKLKNSKKLLMFPPSPMEWFFLRFLQKWDALVAKDGESCESGEIGHSRSIWAWFWGKRWKNLQNDQNCLFGANLSHFFGKIRHINQDSAEIFKFSSVLIIA